MTDPASGDDLDTSRSLATGQVSLKDRSIIYPLYPPKTRGCPATSTDEMQYPLAVDYDYEAIRRGLAGESDASERGTTGADDGQENPIDPEFFDRPPEVDLERWAPLLPPLSAPGLGAGATPTSAVPSVADWAGVDREVYVKDESQNPTWSQKDRLARLEVGAAVRAGATGVVASSSGNHGASVAAHAARAGLQAVVLTSPATPGAVQEFLSTYGAAVVAVDGYDVRREAVDRLAGEYGFHPTTTRTPVHTGHPFGPEGYKTIAYEIRQQVGVPGAVFVPTAHGELLYGVWKGFRELEALGVTDATPRMIACEPGARAPLATAIQSGEDVTEVRPGETVAHSIAATRSTYRGRLAIEESDGLAIPFSEAHLYEAGRRLAREGIWQEASGAASAASLKAAAEDRRLAGIDGPYVLLGTSSGFKNGEKRAVPRVAAEWDAIETVLSADPNVDLSTSG